MNRPKRIPALLLALVLALGLMTPALAAGKPSAEEALSYINLEMSNWVFDNSIKPNLYYYSGTFGYTYANTPSGVSKVNPDVVLRLTNTAPTGSNIVLYAELSVCEWCEKLWVNDPDNFREDEDGYTIWDDNEFYVYDVYGYDEIYTLDTTLDSSWTYDPWSNGYTKLAPGESCVFKLHTKDHDPDDRPSGYDPTAWPSIEDGTIATVSIYASWNDETYSYYRYWTCMIDSSVPAGHLKGAEPLQFRVKESRMLDNGVGYNYTITNNTDEQMTGYYALLSYQPQKGLDEDGDEYFHAQVHTFDVDLAPGESMGSELSSYFYDLSGAKNIWITFDSKAERDSFLASPALNYWASYYLVTSEQWLKDNFNITLLPAK